MDNLQSRYELIARAEGASPKTMDHVRLAVRLFNNFMGGIQDVRKVMGDDLRRFTIFLEQRRKWAGTSHEKEEKISRTTLNAYVRV